MIPQQKAHNDRANTTHDSIELLKKTPHNGGTVFVPDVEIVKSAPDPRSATRGNISGVLLTSPPPDGRTIKRSVSVIIVTRKGYCQEIAAPRSVFASQFSGT